MQNRSKVSSTSVSSAPVVSQISPWTALGLTLVAGLVLSSTAMAQETAAVREDDRQVPQVPAGEEVTEQDLAQFGRRNTELLAWLPLNKFEGVHNAGNDCWGYVSPSGREYAIMGLESGFGFVEVTDPTNPVIIETIPGPTSTWHDVKVIGTHAYGVSEGGAGIQVMDMSQIDDGIVTLVQNKQQNGHSTTHNIVSNTDSGYVYLVGANIANGGLVAVDVTTDPNDPNIVGAWNQMYIHDAQVVTFKEGPYAGREIAYVLAGFGGGSDQTGLRIVDVTDKNNMFTVSTALWSRARYAHQGWLSTCRKYIYINDELDEGNSVTETTTRIFNVEDIENPHYVGTVSSGLPAIDHNLYTTERLMFQANYRSGLRIFDYTDRENPYEIAYFDTYPEDDAASFNGAWSTYPYLPSGTVLISDIERGLFLIRLSGEAAELLGD